MKFPIKRVFLFFLIIFLPNVEASIKESELYRALMAKYNHLVRPVRNPHKPLTVAMKVFLQQIIDVDEKDQVVEVNAWLKYTWHDYRLRWSPSNFENITSIRFASSNEDGLVTIWKPDVLLYNSADEKFDSTFKANLVVYNTGEVNWIPPGIFKISCKIDITWFPFDSQTCFMKFGSWTYHGRALDLQIDVASEHDPAMDLSTYVSNGEWLLVDTPVVREEQFYACCPEPYPTIKFYLHIRRRTLYYGFNLIVPSLLISLMTLMCFCLPVHDMAEKIGYQTTILLSVCFFLTILSEMTPNTSEAIPLIGIFFSTVTLIISVSTAFTITALSLRYRQPANHKMTDSMRYFFIEFLPWLLLMNRPGHKYHKGKSSEIDRTFDTECVQCVNRDRVEVITIDLMDIDDPARDPLLSTVTSIPTEKLGIGRKVGEGLFSSRRSNVIRAQRTEQFEKYIKKCVEETDDDQSDFAIFARQVIEYYSFINRHIRTLREDYDQKKELQRIHEEWKFAAMVLDRLCLVIFTLFLSISIGTIFYMAPYLNA